MQRKKCHTYFRKSIIVENIIQDFNNLHWLPDEHSSIDDSNNTTMPYLYCCACKPLICTINRLNIGLCFLALFTHHWNNSIDFEVLILTLLSDMTGKRAGKSTQLGQNLLG